MKKLLLLLPLIVLLTVSCGQQQQVQRATFYAFGTQIDISLYGVDSKTANITASLLEDEFTEVNNLWHAWQPSTLTRINQAISQGKPIAVSDDVAAVINHAKQLSIASHDLFNPAAGKLFELWGYHSDSWFESRPPPSQQSIQQWLDAHPTMADVHIRDGQLSSTNPMVKLGFGAFAKGYAVNHAIAILKQHHIENAIVNIGGDLRAIGQHGDRPWIIGIRHPRHDGTLASVKIHHDESVFTSGDYERFFTYQGVRYPHILDPRTGYPARDLTSVTVMSNDAAKADAAATALLVAGKDWPEIAKSMGVIRVMVVTAAGQVEMTPEMQQRVSLTDKSTVPVIRDLSEQPKS